jgi:hypothetical protein
VCTTRADSSSPVFAIEHVPDDFAPLSIYFVQRFALFGAQGLLVRSHFRLGRAALRTAIGKSRFARPQFKLFSANDARFDRKTHPHYVKSGLRMVQSDYLY